jgi:hypothetical protein
MSFTRKFKRKKDYDAQRERMLERREERKKHEEEHKLTTVSGVKTSSRASDLAAAFLLANAMIYHKRPEL